MAIPNKTVGAGRIVRTERDKGPAPVPNETEPVRHVNILFEDGTIYETTLTEADILDDSHQGTIVIQFANEAREMMFINKNNLCYLNVRHAVRQVPQKQYVPTEKRQRSVGEQAFEKSRDAARSDSRQDE